MISFKQYLSNFNKKYVCVEFTTDTNNRLRNYCLKNGFDLSVNYEGDKQDPKDYKFHTTIFFTTTKHDDKDEVIKLNKFELIPTRLDLLGPDKDVPVLKLNMNDELNNLREIFIKKGYRDSWDNYIPHISLSYNRQQYNLSNIELPTFPIVVNELKISSPKEQ